ncbi:MAG: hypothetical protein OWT27_07660, partial [Firmicutes bacterium]|nr:hypothetical protein [Bacillota bacterium]
RHGPLAPVAIAVSASLFFILGAAVMELGRRHPSSSLMNLFEHRLGASHRVAAAAMTVILFGVTVAMIAGAGALLHEQFGLSIKGTELLCALVAWLTVVAGLRAIVAVNSVIVPCMIAFVVALFALRGPSFGAGGFALPSTALAQAPVLLWSAFAYAGLNVGLAIPVLVPLGRVQGRWQTLVLGSLLGSGALFTMLLLIHLVLAQSRIMTGMQVPMAALVATLGPALRGLFTTVLLCEIYSTLIANAYGIAAELSARWHSTLATRTAVVLALATVFAQVGFARIVAVVYPVFGYIGIALLLALLAPIRRRRSARHGHVH